VSEDSVEKLGPISQYLTEDIFSVRERERSAFEQMLGAHRNRVVVFGCGGLGRRAIERLAELRVRPLAFCDNNQLLWGTEVLGVKVLSVAEAAAQFGGDALFLIAVWNPDHWYYETAEQLKTAGARSIVSFLPLFWRFPDSLLPFPYLNAIPSRVYEAVDDVLVVEKFWRDDLSLDIYVRISCGGRWAVQSSCRRGLRRTPIFRRTSSAWLLTNVSSIAAPITETRSACFSIATLTLLRSTALRGKRQPLNG